MTPCPAVPTPPPEPDSVEALLIERDSLGVLNDRLRQELRESEQARAGLAARVRELETLLAMYARGGAQA